MRKILLDSCTRPGDDQIETASTHLAGRLDVGRAVDLLVGPSATLREREDTLTTSSLPRMETDRSQSISPQGQRIEAGGDADAPANITPSEGLVPARGDCGCGGQGGECTCGGTQKAQLVYAIGRLGVSFISQSRRDLIWRLVNGSQEGDLKPISNDALEKLFQKQPFQSQSVIWTLSRTEVPMYAIAPAGAFAAETYAWLVSEWSDKNVEFVSLPGVLAGSTVLYDGQAVDVVMPDLRGMYSCSQPRHRARALPRRPMFHFVPARGRGKEGLSLKYFGKPGRHGASIYVLLTFFDLQGRAPLRARFTIDVADTVPVMIGDPATWRTRVLAACND